MKFPAQAALPRICVRGQVFTACAMLPTALYATVIAVCLFMRQFPYSLCTSPLHLAGCKDEGESCYVFDQNLPIRGGSTSHGCGWDCNCPNEQSCLSGASKLGCVWTGEHCVRRFELDDRLVKSNGNGAQTCGCNCGAWIILFLLFISLFDSCRERVEPFASGVALVRIRCGGVGWGNVLLIGGTGDVQPKPCLQLDRRVGGCGNTCNCPNMQSCLSGSAKDQCMWTASGCKRVANNSECGKKILGTFSHAYWTFSSPRFFPSRS